MDRQIKFRGQLTDTKKWVFGYYFNHAGIDRIFVPEKGSFTVIPGTVGQFTGLTDKNGTEVYERDYISYLGAIGVVFYESNTAMFMVRFEISRSVWSFNSMDDVIEVIGNIHQESEVTNG